MIPLSKIPQGHPQCEQLTGHLTMSPKFYGLSSFPFFNVTRWFQSTFCNMDKILFLLDPGLWLTLSAYPKVTLISWSSHSYPLKARIKGVCHNTQQQTTSLNFSSLVSLFASSKLFITTECHFELWTILTPLLRHVLCLICISSNFFKKSLFLFFSRFINFLVFRSVDRELCSFRTHYVFTAWWFSCFSADIFHILWISSFFVCANFIVLLSSWNTFSGGIAE